MIITVVIDTQPFEIDCDTGIQDIAWLSLCACNLYGQSTYPVTTFLPILAKNQNGVILHPKLVLVKNQELIGNKIYVDVRKKESDVGFEMNDKQKEWYDDAFLEGRFKMAVSLKFRPSNEIRKDNKFKIQFRFEINPKIAIFYPNFGETVDIELNQPPKNKRDFMFEGEARIPLGILKPEKILFCQKTVDTFEKESYDFIKNELTYYTVPNTLTEEDKDNYLRKKEDLIRDKEIQIKQNILNAEKEKKEEEERFEQLKKFMTQIPFTLEEVYQYVKEQIDMNEQDLVEIFELLERNQYLIYRKLFELFFDYCQFYENNTELTIDSTAVLNILNSLYGRRKGVEKIGEEFENLYISRLERDGTQIDFREFIYILIFLLYNLMIHSSINICNEITFLTKKYETVLENYSIHEFFKNKDIISTINVNYRALKNLFNRYAIKKEYSEPNLMTAEKFLSFTNDVAYVCKYDLVRLIKENVKTESNIDIFDFLRRIVAMALNLIWTSEDYTEDNIQEEGKQDEFYKDLTSQEAVNRFVSEVLKNFKEKDTKEKKFK